MSWKEFETFSTDVLARHYRPFQIKLLATQYSKDGARDAEAYHVFAASQPDSPLAIPFRLWVEVKHRSGPSLGLQDIGKNLVRAVNERVSKLIFVTNCDYTEGAREDIKLFCDRLGLGYALVNGPLLLELAAKPMRSGRAGAQLAGSSAPNPALRASGCFTLDPFRSVHDAPSATVTVRKGQPVFVVVDLSAVALREPRSLDVHLSARDPARLTVHRYAGAGEDDPAQGGCCLLAAGDCVRQLFVVWPEAPGEYGFDDLELSVRGAEDVPVTMACAGRFRTEAEPLAEWIPPSRQRPLTSLEGRVESWLHDPGAAFVCLLAGAGVGKSLATARVRRRALRGGAREVYLDGEHDRSRRDIIESILQRVFPIPAPALGEERRDDLHEWLAQAGVSESAAGALAEWICASGERDVEAFDSRRLGELAAALLVQASERAPLLLVFEDLHKIKPSAVGLVHEVHRHLRTLGRGRVFVLCTTREAPEAEDAAAAGWHAQLREFVSSGLTERRELGVFTDDEAAELVRRSVPLLARSDAETIVRQVGRTPFALREAILFLESEGITRRDPLIGEFLLLEPERLRGAIETDRLHDATAGRLAALRAAWPEWLGTLLDAGACLGRAFDPEPCVAVAGGPDAPVVQRALAECERLAVLRPSVRDPALLEFDHDLVRRATLRVLRGSGQRRVAGLLYDHYASRGMADGDALLCSLAYQAGRAEAAVEHGTREGEACARRGHHPEAIQYFYIALGCMEAGRQLSPGGPLVASARGMMDDAVALAAACHLPGPPNTERHRRVLELIRRLLGSLGAISSGSSEAFERALTEGRMLAQRLRDPAAEADVTFRFGLMLLERDQVWDAARQHRQVEEYYARTPGRERAPERSSNMIRLAICHRAAGDIERCMGYLRLALRLSPPASWSVLSSFLANAGGACFFRDWERVRRLWTRALRVAERHGLKDRVAHHLVDLAHLDLLEDRLDDARERLERASRIGEENGLENLLLRTHLNSACVELMEGRPDLARFHLDEAEHIGTIHLVGRRIWRVWSNRATAEEAAGEPKLAYMYDRRALHAVLPGLERKVSELGEAGLFVSRDILAVGNVCLRAAQSEYHAALAQTLPDVLRVAGERMSGALLTNNGDSIPGLLGGHAKRIADHPRFVVTE